MNKKLRAIFFPFCLIMIFLSCLFFSEKMRRPDEDYKLRPFLESQTEFDILFFGTSHVLTSIFPMRLWNDYGITSYNLSAHGCPIQLSYWILRNTARIHKPKFAVLDVFALAGCQLDMNQYHRAYDAIPMSATKLESFIDIFGAKDFLKGFSFSMNHNFWDKSSYGTLYETTAEMGAEPIYLIRFNHSFGTISREFPGHDTAEIIYVQKFIDFCMKNNIIPILTFIPFDVGQDSLKPWAEYLFGKARKMGVPCLEIEKSGIVDFEIDMADADSHLNPNGGRKVTDYIGKFIAENYETTNHKVDENYSAWRDTYENYKNILRSRLKSQKDFKMVLLSFDKSLFSGKIKVKEGHNFSAAEKKFLDELKDSVSVDYVDEDIFSFEIFDKESHSLIKKFDF